MLASTNVPTDDSPSPLMSRAMSTPIRPVICAPVLKSLSTLIPGDSTTPARSSKSPSARSLVTSASISGVRRNSKASRSRSRSRAARYTSSFSAWYSRLLSAPICSASSKSISIGGASSSAPGAAGPSASPDPGGPAGGRATSPSCTTAVGGGMICCRKASTPKLSVFTPRTRGLRGGKTLASSGSGRFGLTPAGSFGTGGRNSRPKLAGPAAGSFWSSNRRRRRASSGASIVNGSFRPRAARCFWAMIA